MTEHVRIEFSLPGRDAEKGGHRVLPNQDNWDQSL